MSLFQPEFGLMFWMLVVFLIVLFILAKFAWPVIIKNMEKRADFIDDGIKFSQDAIERKKQADRDAEALLKETRMQQRELLKESEKLKQKIIADAKESAGEESRKIVEAARISAEQIKRDAEVYIRNEVVVLSLEIAEKVLRKELADKEEQERLINEYLKEMH